MMLEHAAFFMLGVASACILIGAWLCAQSEKPTAYRNWQGISRK